MYFLYFLNLSTCCYEILSVFPQFPQFEHMLSRNFECISSLLHKVLNLILIPRFNCQFIFCGPGAFKIWRSKLIIQRNNILLIATSDNISYFGPKPSSFICISIFLYSTPQSLHFTSRTCISYCICFRICVCIPKLIILVIPAAVPPHLSCCECSVQGWLVKACMQALLASYHALVHFLATALLLFVLYICTLIYIFYVIH